MFKSSFFQGLDPNRVQTCLPTDLFFPLSFVEVVSSYKGGVLFKSDTDLTGSDVSQENRAAKRRQSLETLRDDLSERTDYHDSNCNDRPSANFQMVCGPSIQFVFVFVSLFHGRGKTGQIVFFHGYDT